MIALAGFLCCVTMSMPQQHLVAYCSDLGISATVGATMLSVLLGMGFFSRQGWGWLSDRMGGVLTAFCSSILQCLAMSGFLFAQDPSACSRSRPRSGSASARSFPAYVLTIRELYPMSEAHWRVPAVLLLTGSGMGDRRLARGLSLRHLWLLHAGLRHRRRLQHRQHRDPVHAAGAAEDLRDRDALNPSAAANFHHQDLFASAAIRARSASHCARIGSLECKSLSPSRWPCSPCRPIGHAQTFKSSAGDLKVETVAEGLSHPWALAFLPDGRMLVTERPGRMRIVDAGRQAVGAAARRAEGRCVRPGRPARRRARPRFRAEQDDLFLLRRARERRRAHRDGARDAWRRQARRRQGDLPPGRPAVERQPFRLPHRAKRGQQPVPDDGRALHRSRRGAEPRRTISARSCGSSPTARCRTTIRSSAATTPSRKSGATATATRRARRSIPRPASSGSTSTAPRGGDEINIPRDRQELRLAGDRLRHRLRRHAGRQRQAPRSPAWSSRSNTGCRRSRRPAWRSTPATCFRRGRAACSSARWPARCWCG